MQTLSHGAQGKRVLILGGGYAGLMAAARIARSRTPLNLMLVDARPEFVQRIRLHELLAGIPVATLPYAPLLARRGIGFVQAEVERLELDAQKAVARSVDGSRVELEFDLLVLTLGSRGSAPIAGVVEHAIRLNDPDALRREAEALPEMAASGGRLLVVGGGLTGMEAATEIAERYPGVKVTLATTSRLGAGFSEGAARHLRRRFDSLGIAVHEKVNVEAVGAGEAHLGGGGTLPFDRCIWSGGFEAAALAREAGMKVDAAGRALVDSSLRSVSHGNVFVAGDAALLQLGGREIRMGCVTAMPTGAHAGENVRRLLLGAEPVAFDFGFPGRNVSLGRKDALIQFTDREDRPMERILTGRAAGIVKEGVCRMTLAVPRTELRTGLPLYRWPYSGKGAAGERANPDE